MNSPLLLYLVNLACVNLVYSDPVIIPYNVTNIRFMTLYGIITRSLPAYYSCVEYTNRSLPHWHTQPCSCFSYYLDWIHRHRFLIYNTIILQKLVLSLIALARTLCLLLSVDAILIFRAGRAIKNVTEHKTEYKESRNFSHVFFIIRPK